MDIQAILAALKRFLSGETDDEKYDRLKKNINQNMALYNKAKRNNPDDPAATHPIEEKLRIIAGQIPKEKREPAMVKIVEMKDFGKDASDMEKQLYLTDMEERKKKKDLPFDKERLSTKYDEITNYEAKKALDELAKKRTAEKMVREKYASY